MNQYELTDTLPSLNLSSASSSPPSFHICECYLTRLICQLPPYPALLFPSACPSHLIPPSCCSASANRAEEESTQCVCVWGGESEETETKLSRAEVHTGAAPLAARGMAVKVSSSWSSSFLSPPLWPLYVSF